jgi:hypothetical protein
MNVGDMITEIRVNGWETIRGTYENNRMYNDSSTTKEKLKSGRFITEFSTFEGIFTKEYVFEEKEDGRLVIDTIYLESYERFVIASGSTPKGIDL